MVVEWLIRLARVIGAAELPLIVAVSPALFFPTFERLLVLTPLPLIWLCRWWSGGVIVPRTPLNGPIYVLLAMVGVSVFVTTDMKLSLDKIAGIILGVLLFWSVVRWLKTPDRLRFGAHVFVGLALAMGIVGFLGAPFQAGKIRAISEFAQAIPIPERLLIRKVPGAYWGFNGNPVSAILALFLPLQALLLLPGSQRWLVPGSAWLRAVSTIGHAVVLFFITALIVLWQCRGVWTGLVLAAAILVFLRVRPRLPARLVAGGLAGALALAAVGAWMTGGVTGLVAPVTGTSFVLRQEIWSKAILVIRDHPLVGLGLNMFRLRMPAEYPGFEYPHNPEDLSHAHNNFLHTAAELGVPAMAAYAALWIILFVRLGRLFTRSPDPMYRRLAGGLLAGLIAHFVFGLTDAIALGAKAAVLFWITLAFAVGLDRIASTPAPPGPASDSPPQYG